MTLGEAEEVRAAASASLGEARQRRAETGQTVAALEERVAQGDDTVTAVELLNARHAVELADRRVARLEVEAQGAEEGLTVARVESAVRVYEMAAPALRGMIRDCAQQVVHALTVLDAAVNGYNAAQLKTRRELTGIRHPALNLGPFGQGRVGSERLRQLSSEDLVDVALDVARRRPVKATTVPADCIPARS